MDLDAYQNLSLWYSSL